MFSNDSTYREASTFLPWSWNTSYRTQKKKVSPKLRKHTSFSYHLLAGKLKSGLQLLAGREAAALAKAASYKDLQILTEFKKKKYKIKMKISILSLLNLSFSFKMYHFQLENNRKHTFCVFGMTVSLGWFLKLSMWRVF